MSQKLENHLANGYEVKIGDYISRGFEILKANMGGYIGYMAVFMVLSFFINFIPFGNLILSPLLLFGFYLVSNLISQHKTIPPFGTFFNGFQHAGKLIVIALITFVAYLVCALPFLISVGVSIFSLRGADNSEIISTILAGPLPILGIGLLVIIFLGVSWVFASMIAVFHNKEAWTAMETSRKLVAKNWLMVFLFLIVVGIISMSGFILLGIGILFTLPLGLCSLYAAFEDIAGLPTDDAEIDEIGAIGAEL